MSIKRLHKIGYTFCTNMNMHRHVSELEPLISLKQTKPQHVPEVEPTHRNLVSRIFALSRRSHARAAGEKIGSETRERENFAFN
jgi:hypothetical protein